MGVGGKDTVSLATVHASFCPPFDPPSASFLFQLAPHSLERHPATMLKAARTSFAPVAVQPKPVQPCQRALRLVTRCAAQEELRPTIGPVQRFRNKLPAPCRLVSVNGGVQVRNALDSNFKTA